MTKQDTNAKPDQTDERPIVGTIYRASDGSVYVLSHYDVPLGAEMLHTSLHIEAPHYNYMSRRGGAAAGITDLPVDAEQIWPPLG